jgi:hypothetical protein
VPPLQAHNSPMKLLYSSDDIRGIGLVRSALDEAGITYEMQNETIPYAGAIFYPEVWIIEDNDFARACELRDSVTKAPATPHSAWRCPSCGEALEGQFSSCWKCGANRSVDA